MSTPKLVSDYMRDMQRRSAKSRWGGLSPLERSEAMKALRAKAKRKPRASARRSNQKATKQSGFEDQSPIFGDRVEAGDVLAGERIKARVKASGETFRLIETRKRIVG